ncbi:FAD-binding protein [Myxococcota bacterium]|nr:FAD-binding protein [Myxococcota bacterium]
MIAVDVDACTGCALCLGSCPFGAISMVREKASVDREICTLCGACVEICPDGAISIKKADIISSEGKDVLIFAEQRGGELARVSLELLGVGRGLAKDCGSTLHAFIIGENLQVVSEKLIHCGAQVVHPVDLPGLSDYRTSTYTQIACSIITRLRPGIVLFGATARGRDLAPRVAQRLNTGLTADCTELSIDPVEKILLQTRPTFGGNIMATIITPSRRPQMATVREGVMELPEPDVTLTGLVKPFAMETPLEGIHEFCEVIHEKRRAVTLGKAKIIVAGGRGVGSPQGFELLGQLADLLGGEVAGSRVAVEKQWIERERQVGQTGSAVAPDLYIACGISGSVQHRAGIKGARVVAAINTDPDAPIFHRANFGIVGDVREIIPLLIAALKS